MPLTYKEIELSPLEQAYHFYWWLCAELGDGLNYGVNAKLAHKNIDALMKHAVELGLDIDEPVPEAYSCNGVAKAMWEIVRRIKDHES